MPLIRLLAILLPLAYIVAEILVFIAVAQAIGVLWAILLSLATSVLGVVLVRRQGLSALRQLRSDVNARRMPAAALGNTITIAIAGLLLILPGFITDAIGLILFIPGVRGAMWRGIRGAVKVEGGAAGSMPRFDSRRAARPGVIDLEATKVSPRGGDDVSPGLDERRRRDFSD